MSTPTERLLRPAADTPRGSIPFARPNVQRGLIADRQRAFRRIKLLVGGYAALSLATLVAVVVLRNHSGLVNSAVWTRVIIVVLSSLLTLRFTSQAARGAGRAFLRVRIISAVMIGAIAVIVALPGTFPVWMKVEQGFCGLLLIAVAALINRRYARSLFATR